MRPNVEWLVEVSISQSWTETDNAGWGMGEKRGNLNENRIACDLVLFSCKRPAILNVIIATYLMLAFLTQFFWFNSKERERPEKPTVAEIRLTRS